jgi:hypothetical protein
MATTTLAPDAFRKNSPHTVAPAFVKATLGLSPPSKVGQVGMEGYHSSGSVIAEITAVEEFPRTCLNKGRSEWKQQENERSLMMKQSGCHWITMRIHLEDVSQCITWHPALWRNGSEELRRERQSGSNVRYLEV